MLATSYFAGRSRLPVLSSSNCKWALICICICICVCICISMCNCVCVCICIFICNCVCLCVYLLLYFQSGFIVTCPLRASPVCNLSCSMRLLCGAAVCNGNEYIVKTSVGPRSVRSSLLLHVIHYMHTLCIHYVIHSVSYTIFKYSASPLLHVIVIVW